MSAVGDLVVNFLGNVKPFQQSVQHMQRMVKTFGTQTKSGMSSAMGSIGDTLAKRAKSIGSMAGGALAKAFKWAVIGGLVGLATAAIGGAAWSVKLASDLEETQSKFNVVFRNVQAEAMETAEELRKYLGQSTLETLRGMADLGDTFKPLGFAERDAMKMAAAITRLAGDLSSFSNMDYSEAFERLQGTLIGNHENALRFGVVINEASLKAKMAQLGINGLTGALDNQAKVLARYAILMEGTSDAHGDLGRTAGSFANTMRKLWSQVQELATAFGTALLPVATAAGNVLSALGERLNDIASAALPGVQGPIDAIASAINSIADGVRAVQFESWQSGLTTVFDFMRGAFSEVGKMAGTIFVDVAERFAWTFTQRTQEAVRDLIAQTPILSQWFGNSMGVIGDVVRTPLDKVIRDAAGQAGANIRALAPQLPGGISGGAPMQPNQWIDFVRGPQRSAGFDVAGAAAGLAGQAGPSAEMKSAAEKLTESMRTPLERMREEWTRSVDLFRGGLITEETLRRSLGDIGQRYGGGMGTAPGGPQFAGLATKNSVEAYKAVIGAQARAETAAEKTQLKTLPEMVTQLQRINEQLSREGWEI